MQTRPAPSIRSISSRQARTSAGMALSHGGRFLLGSRSGLTAQRIARPADSNSGGSRVRSVLRQKWPKQTATAMTNSSISTWPIGLSSGVVMHNGMVYLMAQTSTTARIWNPLTDTITTPNGSYGVSSKFSSCCTLHDGRIFIAPQSLNTDAAIYDPFNDSIITPVGVYTSMSLGYMGCIVMKNGCVLVVPRDATQIKIYNPFSNSVSTPSATMPGSLHGACLLLDGRVFLAPAANATARIYNPDTDEVTIPNGTYPTSSVQFQGCVTMPDGRVFIVPRVSTTARIYNPYNDTLSTPSPTFTGGCSACLMADGRVFINAAASSSGHQIYDPINDTRVVITPTFAGSSRFRGCVLLEDGRIFAIPSNVASGAECIYGSPVASSLPIFKFRSNFVAHF